MAWFMFSRPVSPSEFSDRRWAAHPSPSPAPRDDRRCKRVPLVILFVAWIVASGLEAAPVSHHIKLDTFGYRPGDTKIAIFSADPGSTVEVRDAADTVVLTVPIAGGSITSMGNDGAPSGDTVWWVDFSPLTAPGIYRLYSPALAAQSYDFEISVDTYDEVMRTALKTFFYQRCNTAKAAVHAGAWADAAACHMTDVAVGPASGHTDHGALDLTGGWHDAGDYNKYVWSAVSTAVLHLLRAFEDNPEVFSDGDLNIPESGNGVPDLLDEVAYELDWLLKMQLPGGAVLSQLHVDGWASNSPPSADTNLRYYLDPSLESGAVFAGTCALAARVYADQGMTAYADTLRTAALATWAWLQSQGDSDVKVWAAAEIFRLDPSQAAAHAYVDTYYPNDWGGRFFNVLAYDTQAALTYVQTAGATAQVKANIPASIGAQVDYILANDDLYRNGMPDWSYHWGSNAMRAGYGVFLTLAAQLGATGSATAAECRAHALDFLHFFHGQNAMSMVYLTNMSPLGGEHSSYQLYHAWFGASASTYSSTNYIGKPAAIAEPDYPYFKGVDNHGIDDNKSSALGPAPGFVPGGPNASYSGTAVPPAGATYLNRFYRDWCDQTVWTAVTWEITENSISYQGPYVALAAAFVTVPHELFSDGFESGNPAAWSTHEGWIWQPTPLTTWQWQLSGTIDTSFDVAVYDIDLVDTPEGTIAELLGADRAVICYFSAGSWEDWRPDAGDYPSEVLGNPLDGWPGERWVDIRRLDVLGPILEARMDLAVTKGCTGVEPDNVDAYVNSSGFPLTAVDQLAFNRFLASEAHARGLSVGLKNDLDQIGDLVGDFDWAINEQCYEYAECDLLQPFIDSGKAVFGVEYSGDESVFCPYFNALGYSWLKKKLDLDAWRVDCQDP